MESFDYYTTENFTEDNYIDFEGHGITLRNPLQTYGHQKTTCPFCSATRTHPEDRSLSCNCETGAYYCHHCGAHGYALARFSRGAKRLAVAPAPPRREYVSLTDTVPTPLTPEMVAWFASRGISAATLESAADEVESGRQMMPQTGTVLETVNFRYYFDGRLVNIKYRTAGKLFKLVPRCRLVPWRIEAIRGKDTVIITEGEIDTLSFMEIGMKNVISLPNGASGRHDFFDELTEEYFADKRLIVLAVDTDEAGRRCAATLLRRFGAERCRVMTYGDDCKDANDLLVRHGGEALANALRAAIR